MTTVYPITAGHVDAFRRHVKHWQKVLNLSDWRISVKKDRHRGGDWNARFVSASLTDRLAHIQISSARQTYPVTDLWLRQLALHELLHLRLHELKEMCASYCEEVAGLEHPDVISAEHAIINPVLLALIPTEDPHSEL